VTPIPLFEPMRLDRDDYGGPYPEAGGRYYVSPDFLPSHGSGNALIVAPRDGHAVLPPDCHFDLRRTPGLRWGLLCQRGNTVELGPGWQFRDADPETRAAAVRADSGHLIFPTGFRVERFYMGVDLHREATFEAYGPTVVDCLGPRMRHEHEQPEPLRYPGEYSGWNGWNGGAGGWLEDLSVENCRGCKLGEGGNELTLIRYRGPGYVVSGAHLVARDCDFSSQRTGWATRWEDAQAPLQLQQDRAQALRVEPYARLERCLLTNPYGPAIVADGDARLDRVELDAYTRLLEAAAR
jgi:hypothetical protein